VIRLNHSSLILPLKKIAIYKELHAELEKLATTNDIKIQDLANAIFRKMLNNHKKEVGNIIKNLKR